MRAALHQPHQPHLRERPLPPAPTGPAERRHIGRGVRHVKGRAVQRHQPQPAIPRPLGRLGRQRPGDLDEQFPQRPGAKPLPGPGDRAFVWHLPAPLPAAHPGQPLDQQPHDLLVAHLGEQAHGQDVVDHYPGGQQPLAPLGPATLSDHPIHQLGREGPGQHPDRDPIRQVGYDRWLDLASAWHPRVLTSGRRTLPAHKPPNPTALGLTLGLLWCHRYHVRAWSFLPSVPLTGSMQRSRGSLGQPQGAKSLTPLGAWSGRRRRRLARCAS
jgi:hypothetical protein